MNTEMLIKKIQSKEWDSKLLDIYVDNKVLDYQKNRYVEAIRKFEKLYGPGEVRIFSMGREQRGFVQRI